MGGKHVKDIFKQEKPVAASMANLLCITCSQMQQQEALWPLWNSHRRVWSQHVCMALKGAFYFSEYFLYPPPPLPETPPLGRCVSLGRGFFSFYGTAGCPALWPHPSSSGSDRWGPVEDALSSQTHAGVDKDDRECICKMNCFCNFNHAKANEKSNTWWSNVQTPLQCVNTLINQTLPSGFGFYINLWLAKRKMCFY